MTEAIDLPTPRVLMVDDNPINLKVLEKLLEREGYDTEMAVNGRDALEMIEKILLTSFFWIL